MNTKRGCNNLEVDRHNKTNPKKILQKRELQALSVLPIHDEKEGDCAYHQSEHNFQWMNKHNFHCTVTHKIRICLIYRLRL